MKNAPKSNKRSVWRRLFRCVKHKLYRWETRHEWWVISYDITPDQGELIVSQSGKFASMTDTIDEAIEDARSYIERSSIIAGDCTFVVRRPNLVELFFR